MQYVYCVLKRDLIYVCLTLFLNVSQWLNIELDFGTDNDNDEESGEVMMMNTHTHICNA